MHATKEISHHSIAETISKLTVHSYLLQNYFSPTKFLIFLNDEVWAARMFEVREHYPMTQLNSTHHLGEGKEQ